MKSILLISCQKHQGIHAISASPITTSSCSATIIDLFSTTEEEDEVEEDEDEEVDEKEVEVVIVVVEPLSIA